MESVTFFVKQHYMVHMFNYCQMIKPPYSGFAQFNKPYSQVTQWNGKEMKAFVNVIVPVFMLTLLNPLASEIILFTKATLCFKHFVYFHLIAQYRYHTEATIEYIEKYQEESHYQKNQIWQFRTIVSIKTSSKACTIQPTLDTLLEWENDLTWNNVWAVAKCPCVDEGSMQIKSENAQHLVNKSDFSVRKINLLYHISHDILQLGNRDHASTEIPIISYNRFESKNGLFSKGYVKAYRNAVMGIDAPQFTILEYPLIILFILIGAILSMSSSDLVSMFLAIGTILKSKAKSAHSELKLKEHKITKNSILKSD